MKSRMHYEKWVGAKYEVLPAPYSLVSPHTHVLCSIPTRVVPYSPLYLLCGVFYVNVDIFIKNY